jgi:cytochrome b pre-mRNA-processing protein 3
MRRLRQWWARRVSKSDNPAWRLYRGTAAAAVAPARLTLFGLSHEPEDKFECLALHLAAVWHRLDAGDDDLRRMRRHLTSAFVADMDASLRDMGAGDLGVGKRVKVLTERLYGRLAAYEAALVEGADAEIVEAALLRNMYKEREAPAAEQLAAAREAVAELGAAWQAQSDAALLAGEAIKIEA